MRRAQIDNAFTWILVLFAGAFFLLLFIALARFIINTGDARTNVDSLANIDSIIERSRANFNIQTTAYLPEITLSCDEETFTFHLKEQTHSYNAHTIFAPEKFSGETLIFSQNFTLGVPITTFTHFYPRNNLYITNMPEAFPNTVTTTDIVFNLNEIDTDSYEGVVVVSTDALAFNKIISANNVRGIYVDEGNKQVQFYTYKNGFVPAGGPQPYYGVGFLNGALATADATLYACAIKNTETHLKFLAGINKVRAQIIKDEGWQNVCTHAYMRAIAAFTTLQNPTPAVLEYARQELIDASNILTSQSCPNIL